MAFFKFFSLSFRPHAGEIRQIYIVLAIFYIYDFLGYLLDHIFEEFLENF